MTDEMIEAVARAICKSEMSDVGTFGTEICCQFAPASQRYEGGENLERCCWKDSIDTARAAMAAHESALAKAGLGIRPRKATKEMVSAASFSANTTAIWQDMWDHYKPDG